MEKKELLKLIEDLKVDKNEIVILSTGALVLRGIMDQANDLDIAVTKKGLEQLKNNYNLVQKPNGFYIVNDLVECVEDEMEGKKELVDKYYLQDIHDYYNFIKNSGREKDIPKIKPVEEYIRERETNVIKKLKSKRKYE